jgi:hypothetical protein
MDGPGEFQTLSAAAQIPLKALADSSTDDQVIATLLAYNED